MSSLLPELAKLDGLSNDELKTLYDFYARKGMHEYATFVLDELPRREASERERWMLLLTLAIFALTIVNVIVVVRAA